MPRQRTARVERAALWVRADWIIALGLAVLTVLTRLPFRTRMIYAWDGGLFARALQDYDVVPHLPQPPGYIFYVGAGKVVQALTGLGANDTYVAISIGAASLTVATLYLLGSLIFDRTVGILTAGLALTSVSFWFFSELAYPYTVLALGSTLLALLCWTMATRRFPWPPLAALAFGLLAGFRQDLLPFLGPLFAACYIAALGAPGSVGRGFADGAWLRRGAAQLGLGLLAGAAGIAAWWIATDLASEGWGSLWRALTIQSANVERGTSAFATGSTGLRGNGTLVLWFSKDALHLAAFPALVYLLQWPLHLRREGWRAAFLLLWMLPAMGFYVLVHIGEAGYVFSFLPATLLAAGAGLARAAEAIIENLPRTWGVARRGRLRVGLVVALAALILPYHVWLFVGSARLVSAERLACKDEALVNTIRILPAQYPPATTEIVTSTYLQHAMIYLPQYPHVRFLDPDRDLTWTPAAGIDRVVVFDLELVQRFEHRDRWTLIPLNAGTLPLRIGGVPLGNPLHDTIYGPGIRVSCDGRYHLATVPAAGSRFRFDAARFTLDVER